MASRATFFAPSDLLRDAWVRVLLRTRAPRPGLGLGLAPTAHGGKLLHALCRLTWAHQLRPRARPGWHNNSQY